MGKLFDGVDARLREWIAAQALFFVASAPMSGAGHVNISPKGPIGTLRILDEHTAAYLDMVGSGAETIAHVRENGRMVIMLCAFSGPPRIVRLHGRGEVVLASDARFEALFDACAFEDAGVPDARRAIVLLQIERIADSCGYGVPLMEHRGERPHAEAWALKKLRAGGPRALEDYKREKNAVSIDGLPGVEAAAPPARG